MTDKNVIPLDSARSRRRSGRPVQPPSALGRDVPATDRPQDADEVDYRLRMQQNLAAIVVVVVLVVLGGWLIDRLRTYSRVQGCLEAGHRNCVPLDIEPHRGR